MLETHLICCDPYVAVMNETWTKDILETHLTMSRCVADV